MYMFGNFMNSVCQFFIGVHCSTVSRSMQNSCTNPLILRMTDGMCAKRPLFHKPVLQKMGESYIVCSEEGLGLKKGLGSGQRSVLTDSSIKLKCGSHPFKNLGT
jgi:hypothetical protein